MPRKKKLPRPTYRQHSDDVIHGDIRARVIQGTPMFDFLSEVTLEPVEGASEFERGVREGRRRLAGDIIGIALSDAVN